MFSHNTQGNVCWKLNTADQYKHLHCQAKWRRGDLDLFCNHRTWTPCSHWVNGELLCLPKYCSVTSVWQQTLEKTGSYNMAMISRTPANLQQETAWLKCYGGTLKELCKYECLQLSMNWSYTVKKSGPKALHNNVWVWWSRAENKCFKLLLLKMLLTVIESWGVLVFFLDFHTLLPHFGSAFVRWRRGVICVMHCCLSKVVFIYIYIFLIWEGLNYFLLSW